MSQDRLKVLLIEHDAGFARTVRDMIGQARELDADLRSAPDLKVGLSALTEDHFDVVGRPCNLVYVTQDQERRPSQGVSSDRRHQATS